MGLRHGVTQGVTQGVTIALLILSLLLVYMFHHDLVPDVQKTYENYRTHVEKHGKGKLVTLGITGEFTLHTWNIAIIKLNSKFLLILFQKIAKQMPKFHLVKRF